MNLKSLNIQQLTNLTSLQVDHVTCLECCKYYIAPETAACGHTLCHTCWRGRRTCPSCAAPLDRRSLKLNIPIQTRTEHIQRLGEVFEKLYNIKLDEFILDVPSNESESVSDPTKNVKDWLASSQNHFSAPLLSSELTTQELGNPIEITSSNIQVHVNSEKGKSPKKVIHVPQPQDDWDKIEQLPDTEEITTIKHTSTEQIYHDEEYSNKNPRRSSRKRDLNQSDPCVIAQNSSIDKEKSEHEKSSTKAKQNWNNVKKMRKEFSKLNKKNRNKLNVSIEMCKKTQSVVSKSCLETEQHKLNALPEYQTVYTIDDNTPVTDKENIIHVEPRNIKFATTDGNVNKDNSLSLEIFTSDLAKNEKQRTQADNDIILKDATKVEEINLTKEIIEHQPLKMPFIKKSGLCQKQSEQCNVQTIHIDGGSNQDAGNSEDIEISIKIGNTLTNICIKKKSNDVQLKVNTDREVQTSLGSNNLVAPVNFTPSVQNRNKVDDNKLPLGSLINENILKQNKCYETSVKPASSKKNTASAETTTAQFEITESVEKELSNIMECEENANNINKLGNKISCAKSTQNSAIISNKCNIDVLEDLDVFEVGSGYVKNVQSVKKLQHCSSNILMPSSNRNIHDKRGREEDENDYPSSKKIKYTANIDNHNKNSSDILRPQKTQNIAPGNDSINYDVVMDQVFANIDADIEKSQKSIKKSNTRNETISQDQETTYQTESKVKNNIDEKYSENLFSIIEKDTNDIKTSNGVGSTQRHIENLLTPGMCEDLVSTQEDLVSHIELVNKDICTPSHDPHDDSDKSVVEETPQKNVSFLKQRSKNEASLQQEVNTSVTKNINDSQVIRSIINVSDSVSDSVKTGKDVTIINVHDKNNVLETPLTINRFVDRIKHNSTPVARKSLNFEKRNLDNDDDPELTLCPSSVVAKTTQEKENISRAYEQTAKTPVRKPLMTRNIKANDLKFCIAGSCLSSTEIANLKLLCQNNNWRYVDKYTNDLTHLIVGVDEEYRSQRSVKYMCALAASKWILSYEWVAACLNVNIVVGEHHFEVLDSTGEPGPKRSRLAKGKLFEGFTFFCMPPFSVLDLTTLKDILEASGGKVVVEAAAVRAMPSIPSLLLAEPENTQEDRFTYLVLELGIVPVNYEWVLNCLGNYTLSSIHDLLLCPLGLLPRATATWPSVLVCRDSE